MKTKDANMDQVAALFAETDDSPLAVVNLVKFYPQARYTSKDTEYGHGATGRDAYQRYMDAYMELIGEHGGRCVYLGNTLRNIIGDGDWDAVWINMFPSRKAFREATASERYAAMARHRKAGLDYQEAIVTSPAIFGGL